MCLIQRYVHLKAHLSQVPTRSKEDNNADARRLLGLKKQRERLERELVALEAEVDNLVRLHCHFIKMIYLLII